MTRWLFAIAALLLAALTAHADVNRQVPNTTTDPSGVAQSTYVDAVSEEVEALWRIGVEPLDSVSGTNTITASPLVSDTGFAAYEEGNKFSLIPAANNTGAVTINIAGRGAKAIKTAAGSALTGGEMVSGTLYTIEYDGTDFRLSAGAYDLGAGINGATAKSTPVDADEFVISDSADANTAKKTTLAELKGVISGAPTIVDEVEPTSDTATLTVTGLSDYRDIEAWFVFQNTSSATVSFQARTSGGTWRPLGNISTGAQDAVWGHIRIRSFGRSTGVKFWSAEAYIAGTQGSVDRSDNIDSQTPDASFTGYASYSEQWDEFRLSGTNNFEGSTADERSYLIVYGSGDGG